MTGYVTREARECPVCGLIQPMTAPGAREMVPMAPPGEYDPLRGLLHWMGVPCPNGCQVGRWTPGVVVTLAGVPTPGEHVWFRGQRYVIDTDGLTMLPRPVPPHPDPPLSPLARLFLAVGRGIRR